MVYHTEGVKMNEIYATSSSGKKGKARDISKANHPAGKGLADEATVLEGLKRKVPKDIDVEIAELEAWLAEYAEVRAELEMKQVEHEFKRKEREAERRRIMDEQGQ
jgi:hypothetical protein